MRTITLLLMLGLSQIGIGQDVPTILIYGYTPKLGYFPFVKNESIAMMINRTGAITVTSAESERYNRGEPIRDVKLKLYRDKKTIVLAVDQKDLWTRKVLANDIYEVSRPPLSFVFGRALILTPQQAEPAGSAHPATKPADKVPAEVQPSPPTSKDVPK